MEERRERIVLQLPGGAVGIRRARCPNGCDLMDATAMIHDLPSIRVRYDVAGKGGIIHLDPLYGRFDNLGEGEIPAGAMVEFSCPSCSVSLRAPEGTCETCAGNLFAIHLPGGIVEGCLRRGCHYHRMTIVDDGSLMDRLFSEHGRDSYL